MYLDLKRYYWCPGMKRDCVKYVEKGLTCLKVKAEHQKPYRKIQPLEILVWKWEKITMNFMTKLPWTTKKHDAIWVIVDRLTKSAYFIPIREDMLIHKLAKIYVNEIVARHGVPFLLFWIEIGNWDDHFPLLEFSYNNSYHASIKMPPYEMLYERKYRTPVCWDEVGTRELASTNVVLETTKKIETIRERLKEAQYRWKSYANKRRRATKFNVGDFVMLKVSPWKVVMRFKNKEKVSPRFIGPFKILKRVREVAYTLELPEEMREPITILGRKSRQLRNKEIPLVKVEWKHRKGTSIRWEPEEKMGIRYSHLFQE
nr:reverse transcriptase [Tanacetum cinerariifolium]